MEVNFLNAVIKAENVHLFQFSSLSQIYAHIPIQFMINWKRIFQFAFFLNDNLISYCVLWWSCLRPFKMGLIRILNSMHLCTFKLLFAQILQMSVRWDLEISKLLMCKMVSIDSNYWVFCTLTRQTQYFYLCVFIENLNVIRCFGLWHPSLHLSMKHMLGK